MTDKETADSTAATQTHQHLYEGMARVPGADPATVTARAVSILHAAIRRLPEHTWPRSSQQQTTHRYI